MMIDRHLFNGLFSKTNLGKVKPMWSSMK